MTRSLRLTLAGALAAAVTLGFAAPAIAHVEVSGTDATQGGYGLLTFHVPTESDTAATTDVLVTLPDDQPILSVSTQPKAGWTTTLTKKKLASPQKDDDGNVISEYVSTVEWKADSPAAGIPPNQFDVFNISAGPLPKEAMIYLPTTQTYSDGKVVNWNEKAPMGQPEPDHPAPMLMLAAGTDESGAAPATENNAAASAPAKSTPAWPGITALAVALFAALLGVANLALLRRKSH